MIEAFFELPTILSAIIATALIFDFVNGWNDSSNAIATVIGTRVLTPRVAIAMAAVLNLAGALAGTEVAKTITGGIINTDPLFISSQDLNLALLSAMLSAIIWAAWMTVIGMPISGSHSLIGGLVGGAVAASGVKVIVGGGVLKIFGALLISPLLGGVLAYLLTFLLRWLFQSGSPRRVGIAFSYLQIGSAALMGFTHGLNDAQKVMGIITLALVAGGVQQMHGGLPPEPLFSVKIACAVMISLGTALGGAKVIRTLGSKLSRLSPFDGFTAETGASAVLFGAAALGVPVSTTHTITGSIMGVGATRGIRSVRWAVGEKIVWAWILTLPATGVMSGVVFSLLAELCQ